VQSSVAKAKPARLSSSARQAHKQHSALFLVPRHCSKFWCVRGEGKTRPVIKQRKTSTYKQHSALFVVPRHCSKFWCVVGTHK
jgi:3-deoxy-D-manno-octulosonic-acid transferase